MPFIKKITHDSCNSVGTGTNGSRLEEACTDLQNKESNRPKNQARNVAEIEQWFSTLVCDTPRAIAMIG